MCVHPKVKKPHSTASDINHDCNKLGKDRKCRFRNGLESFVPPKEEGSGETQQQAVMDMEDLIELGKQHKICPFYYTRSQVETAELILVPYNYLFDKDARETTLSTIPWDNSVVIFDEAHNLESFASESASFDLSSTDISGCLNELQIGINYLDGQPDLNFGLSSRNLIELKSLLLKLEDYVIGLGSQTTYSGEFIFEIFGKGAKIHHGNHQQVLETVKKINDMLLDIRGSSSARSGAPRLEHFVQCVKRVFGHSMESKCYAKAAFYRVHVSPKQAATALNGGRNQQQSRTVSFWCFAPSLAMEELAGLKIRSILVTSGTLSPFPSYSLELGIPFPHTLENPHIIANEQIHVRIVGKGSSGKVLNSSFERRKDGEYYSELGSTLVSLAKVTPEGMLIFFPSYSVMETCIERWGGPSSGRPVHQPSNQGSNSASFAARRRPTTNPKYSFPQAPSFFQDHSAPSTPWKRLLATKSIVVEPKSSADLPDAIAEFKRLLALPKSPGCVLMGVCRGKISEGIDFAHEQSRAVVITGLPFPPAHDPKVKMKREFLDQARASNSTTTKHEGGFALDSSGSASSKCLSGLEWYTQQAHRAVNQAIGRVIRNVADYGAVLLLDNRFEQLQNQKGLSMWLRPHIQKDEGFGKTISSLAKFFKDADAKAKETAAKLSSEPVRLAYEDDEADIIDEKLTKVAVVRVASLSVATASVDSENVGNEPTSFLAPDRVIAKVDVRDLHKRPLSPMQYSSSSIPEKKSKPSKELLLESKPAAKVIEPTENNKKVASQFFARARSKLSQGELARLKTAISAVREQGQLKDVSGLLKAASDAVKLLVQFDSLEKLGSECPESNLIILFFQLLPRSYLSNVEGMAMKRTFDCSTLCQICRGSLEPGFFGMFRTQVVALLQYVWCSKSDPSKPPSEYLMKVEAVLRVVLKVEKIGSSVTQAALLQLIPPRYHVWTRSVAHEMKCALKMVRMKATDKEKCTLATVKRDKLISSRSAGTHKERSGAHADNGDKVGILPSTSCAKSQENSAVPSVFNPYASKKLSVKAVPAPRPSPLSLLIEKVESEVYVKQSLAEIVRSLPGGNESCITCPVCSTAAIEPFMADCGHVACLGCWKAWLARSESCPTCRKVTCIESLARIVVSSCPKDDATTFTLSELLPPTAETCAKSHLGSREADENGSESELEIC
jgi:regulator of telomere elongation helicase 1